MKIQNLLHKKFVFVKDKNEILSLTKLRENIHALCINLNINYNMAKRKEKKIC